MEGAERGAGLVIDFNSPAGSNSAHNYMKHLSLMVGSVAVVCFSIFCNNTIAAPAPEQSSPGERLVAAAFESPDEKVLALLTNGVDVNATVGTGLTAWHAAKIRGRAALAEQLARRGADAKLSFPSPEQTIDWMGRRQVPAGAPGLALARYPLSEAEARLYQRGETLPVPETLRGYVAVTLAGVASGFAKAGDGQLKNHYPKGLRRP